jgi:endonuclease/exonuclease/phosphatase family metal-dependent hydrolase
MMQAMLADVIGSQELWHGQSLKNALVAAGMDQSHLALFPPGHARHAGQRIVCAAAMDKSILIAAPRWITTFPTDFILKSSGSDTQTSDIAVSLSTFSRPVLNLTIKPRATGPTISVYVCHFKSRGPTPIYTEVWYDKPLHSRHAEALGGALSTIRRTAEATAPRMILTQKMKDTDTPVVVIGDCNDGQQSNMNILTGQPLFLTALSEGGGDTDLYTAQTLQQYRSQTDVNYTHINNDRPESLDHILVSQEFYDNSRKRIWACDGLEIGNDHLNSTDHKDSGTGDHGVVRARFKYKPAKAILA